METIAIASQQLVSLETIADTFNAGWYDARTWAARTTVLAESLEVDYRRYYRDTRSTGELRDVAPLFEGGIVKVYVYGDEPAFITRERVERAIRLMAEEYPHHFADMVNEDGDATTGDVLIQLCCFGELVYG